MCVVVSPLSLSLLSQRWAPFCCYSAMLVAVTALCTSMSNHCGRKSPVYYITLTMLCRHYHHITLIYHMTNVMLRYTVLCFAVLCFYAMSRWQLCCEQCSVPFCFFILCCAQLCYALLCRTLYVLYYKHCTSAFENTLCVPFVYVRVCLRGKNMKVNPILTLLLVNYSGLL